MWTTVTIKSIFLITTRNVFNACLFWKWFWYLLPLTLTANVSKGTFNTYLLFTFNTYFTLPMSYLLPYLLTAGRLILLFRLIFIKFYFRYVWSQVKYTQAKSYWGRYARWIRIFYQLHSIWRRYNRLMHLNRQTAFAACREYVCRSSQYLRLFANDKQEHIVRSR